MADVGPSFSAENVARPRAAGDTRPAAVADLGVARATEKAKYRLAVDVRPVCFPQYRAAGSYRRPSRNRTRTITSSAPTIPLGA